MHVINVDIQDNHEEATLGAFLICELCQCVSISLPGPPPAHQGFSRKLTSHSVHVQIISKGYNPELRRCPQVCGSANWFWLENPPLSILD